MEHQGANLYEMVLDRARASGGGWLPPGVAATLAARSGLAEDAWLLTLTKAAMTYAQPRLSGFQVGAVGKGVSGALYFGANLEFTGCPLPQTVHAEQAVVANARAHGEVELVTLAVSAVPCGHCRQFLFELDSDPPLRILSPGQPPRTLPELLPSAFGPGDLGRSGGLLKIREVRLGYPAARLDPLGAAAFQAAEASYAPYTGALAGVALAASSGRVYSGSYLENAAFNPTLPPLQAAWVAFALGESANELPIAAALVETEDSRVDHARAAREMLKVVTPGLDLRVFRAGPSIGRLIPG